MEIITAVIRNAYRDVRWEHQVMLMDRDAVLQTLWKLNVELRYSGNYSVFYVSKHPDVHDTVVNRIL
jgi:hypothetical protein